MYIEAIILEGFKSYSNRVYVGPMHPHFNAVTGLNGTGKSNILDAICFVLGITNHSLVRATKLDDLVYKQGQAGVTKATVTIKFRNDLHQQEKRNILPFPYREMAEITVTRQIVIELYYCTVGAAGGRDRYLVNGRNAQQKEVRDLFHSCQLNVNNPHFLIQQGKITRVVNMKPKELLGLIEEVAGTRLYEYKRASAVKLMQKKDQKLLEIQTVLTEEIQPTLERLRKERQDYYTYIAMKEEMQRLERYDVAYRFYCASQHVTQTNKELESLVEKIEELEKEIAATEQQQEEFQQQLQTLTAERSEQERPLHTVRKKKEEIERLLAKRQSDEKSARRDYTHGKEALEELLREKQRLEKKILEKNQSRQARADRSVEAEEELLATAKEQLLQAEAKLQALLQGYSSSNSSSTAGAEAGEGEGSDVGRRLLRETEAAKHEGEAEGDDNSKGKGGVSSNSTSNRRCKRDREKEEGEAKREHEREAKKERSADASQGIILPSSITTALATAATAATAALGGGSLQEQLRTARTAAATAEATAHELRAEVQHLTRELESLQQETASNLAEREKLEKEREEKTTLLQQLQGQLQQLQHVDADRMQQLQEQKRLRTRDLEAARQEARESLQELEATVKIHVRLPRGVPPEKFYGQVYELIDVQDIYTDLMIPLQLLLGGRLEYIVVQDKESSKAIFQENNFARSRRRVTLLPLDDCHVGRVCDRQITFQSERRLAFPTVTAAGDVFQVGGAMSGGHTGHVGQTLHLWKNYKRCRGRAEQLQEETRQITEELEPLEQSAQQQAQLKTKILLAENSLRHMEQLYAASTVGSAYLREEKLRSRLSECMQRQQEAEKAVATTAADVKRLNEEIYELEHHREEMEAALKKDVAELRQQVKHKEALVQSMQQEVGSHRREMQMLRKEVESVQQDVEERTRKLAILQQLVEEKSMLVAEEKKKIEEVRKEIEGLLEEAARSEKKKAEVVALLRKSQKNKDHMTLQHKKHQHAIQDKEKALAAYKEETTALQRSYPWLHTEQAKINQPNSFYDFQQLRPETARQRLHHLQGQVQRLQRTVNSGAAALLEKTEKDLQALVLRRHKVEEDKSKIETVISELDVKKRHSLEQTWQRVNENFTLIFQQLLPHAQARLGQANPDELMDGLEICVAFHHKWKESLAELSGGQRSLLALALILALLKVKPAPVYILDEVDAALDLSHTQNIGSMIKTQFPSSQFIIVSLKEGMFTHADVLFRTRLTEGVSSIERRCLSETQHLREQQQLQQQRQERQRQRAAREAEAAAEEEHAKDMPDSIGALCTKAPRTRGGDLMTSGNS